MNDQNVDLRYSIHGPVTFIDSIRNKGYSVRCGWLEVGGSPYLASLRMNQSNSGRNSERHVTLVIFQERIWFGQTEKEI